MPPTVNPRMSASDWALLVFLSVLWGGSFFFNRVALSDLPPLSIVAVRVGGAALVLWLALALTRRSLPLAWAFWRPLLVLGILNNAVPFTLIAWGQVRLASGPAAILNASTPLWTVLLAHVLTADERMTPLRVAGVIAGLAGVVVMVGGAAVSADPGLIAAQFACIGAALCYAVSAVFGRRFRELAVSPLATATGQVTVSSLLLVPLALAVDRPWTLAMPGAATFASLASLAVLSTALAYIVYFRLLASAGATNLQLVTFLVPVTAILLGVAVLGETLLPRHLAGMGLIGLGLAAIDGRLLAPIAVRLGVTR